MTTGPLAVKHRRRRSITPRAIEGTSIPCSIFKPSPASCRPTPIAGTTSSTIPRAAQGAITAALCWAHARRQFFELADIAANARRGKNAAAISPVALEAVKRIDALFDIERGINGLSAEERLRVRQEQSAPLLAALETWLREQRSRLSRSASVASRSTTCSSVGTGLLASSKMAGSASRTMQPSVLFEDLRSGESHGSSPAPSAAPTEPRPWPR